MSAQQSVMVSMAAARERAGHFYERHYAEWAADAFAGALLDAAANIDEEVYEPQGPPRFRLGLRPPTERQALERAAELHALVAEWEGAPPYAWVEWETRLWASLGAQRLPCRVEVDRPTNIAAFGDYLERWNLVEQRMGELAGCLATSWPAQLGSCDFAALCSAVRRRAEHIEGLSARNWDMTLLVLDWLGRHPHQRCFVRQLPIRGIDTKWFEAHRALIDPLYLALTGTKLQFAKGPYLARVRFLDPSLAPCGLTEIQAVPSELSGLSIQPHVALICENKVNALALPNFKGTVALCGGGYAVGELTSISWLRGARLLYWGDLDTHGFAILNEARAGFLQAGIAEVESLMMDARTLEAHRDLCVEEPNPARGTFALLTDAEQAALELLRAGDSAMGISSLRLEQERIEWGYALARLEEAICDPL